ncbi:10444_t:CDS:2, partial [Entrophospora sp. SA101]
MPIGCEVELLIRLVVYWLDLPFWFFSVVISWDGKAVIDTRLKDIIIRHQTGYTNNKTFNETVISKAERNFRIEIVEIDGNEVQNEIREQLARSKETLENQMQELGLLDAPDQLLVLKEAEETQKEVIRLERANKALQVELDELKEKLEDERTEKQKGSMNRRKLMSQLQEYQMKLETDTQKYSGWEDSVASYREKITSLASNLESSELARIKAEKSEGLLKLHINELEESMVEICI